MKSLGILKRIVSGNTVYVKDIKLLQILDILTFRSLGDYTEMFSITGKDSKKKWKNFYFILNGSNRELCFFENEKV